MTRPHTTDEREETDVVSSRLDDRTIARYRTRRAVGIGGAVRRVRGVYETAADSVSEWTERGGLFTPRYETFVNGLALLTVLFAAGYLGWQVWLR